MLYDYYRAANRDAATSRPELGRAVAEHLPGEPVFDAVDAKGIDPGVGLGKLVGLIRGVPWSVDLTQSVSVYPPPEGAPQSEEEWESLPEDSPYLEGPGIEELPAAVRDTLADIDDARLPEIAGRWAEIEEFTTYGSVDSEYLLTVAEELVGLARSAKDNDQLLYCWL
ncbi:hypothetical protein OHA77_20055 [Streptosporangium sp. NBC_01639]|uniref:hypothetical protein n=1 Tax=Streptosporangium sp. NBC_01639 TaxID=2975948 RepID=UPI003868E556|nr:hypothetical protein OHA77_20055 [Streptosporangium sp. NBC_01639]